jgi:putative peptide zinc metalloprotease protein
MNLKLSSCLLLVPIEVRKDKKHYIVEDKFSGDFYEMSEVCIDAIHLIQYGEQLGEIEQQLKEKFPQEEVDLLGFATQLLELNLIESIDGVKVGNKQINKEKLGFMWISPKQGKFFFNKVAYIFYFALFVINIVLIKEHPSLFPHYKDIFVFDYMFLNIILWMILTFVLVLFHEIGHVLAMRAHNLPTKLEVGHRLFLVVFETDTSSVWKLPSKKRNVLFLAGICFDTFILSFVLIMQLFLESTSGIFLSIMKVIILDTFTRIVYQFCVYMKTDLYYVIENVSGCYNLMENAQRLLRKWLPFKKSMIKSEEVMFESERKTVFLYSIFYFVGIFLTISLYVIFYIPQLLFAWKDVILKFVNKPTTIDFWDASLFSLQNIIMFMLLFYSWWKKYIKRRQ